MNLYDRNLALAIVLNVAAAAVHDDEPAGAALQFMAAAQAETDRLYAAMQEAKTQPGWDYVGSAYDHLSHRWQRAAARAQRMARIAVRASGIEHGRPPAPRGAMIEIYAPRPAEPWEPEPTAAECEECGLVPIYGLSYRTLHRDRAFRHDAPRGASHQTAGGKVVVGATADPY